MDTLDTILIVDDEQSIRQFLSKALSVEGYKCYTAGNAEEGELILDEYAIGLVLLDLRMPGKSGMEMLQDIIDQHPDIGVIMVTANADTGTAVTCMKAGAYDYITKPVNTEQLYLSVKRALEKRKLELEVREYRQHLEEKIIEQSGRIRASFLNSIRSLVYALEAKDQYTSGHSQRVADISAAIARELHLPQDSIDKIVLAALVHDIGKIGIKESILNKPDKLTEEEFREVQKHPEIGERIMGPVADDEEILTYIRNHHCFFNGKGYPDHLKGYQIPMGARILAVADSYEAMTSERRYRKALSESESIAELIKGKNVQFDPEVVDAFIRSKDHI